MFMNRLVMQIISADILSIDSGIITHQVNCRGVMGAGLAKALRKKYPVIFPEYRQLCINGQLRPGMIQLICVADGLYICNLAGQDGYGTDRQYTDYDALPTALAELHDASISLNLPVYIPYRMGCGLGGGDWDVVSRLIDECCPNAFVVKP